MNIAIVFVLGVLFGCVIAMVVFRVKSVGSLRVDNSDPSDAPYLFLELSKNVDIVRKKKYISLKVSDKNFISHE